MSETGKTVWNPKNSRGIGRSGSFWVRTMHIDSHGDDVLVKAYSQKVGKHSPLQLLLSVQDAEEFSRQLQVKIDEMKDVKR